MTSTPSPADTAAPEASTGSGSFVPYIPPGTKIPELTVKAIVLGVLLALLMAAANAYLGLYVGMTVSATIPAAVIAIAVFRVFKGTILETNLAKTIASAGESLAAGVIFTIPSLVILAQMTGGRAGWANIGDHAAEITVIALLGGILGVIFTISLRRILIVDMDLPYPEGVACTEVLKVSEEGGKGIKYVFSALGLGLVWKLVSSEYGLRLWSERVQTAIGRGSARLFAGSDLSVALLGVGYIVGPRIASFVFLGGALGWLLFIPVIGAVWGWPAAGVAGFAIIREQHIIYMGVGAMIVGGVYTLYTMRDAITKGVREGIRGATAKSTTVKIRTEQDLNIKYSFIGAAAIGIVMFILYYFLSSSFLIAGVSAVIMLIAAFFFTAIAGYIAGVVGSSNNPISGVTVATLVFASLLLLALGASGEWGMTTTIAIAAVVCCSAAIAGDVMQDLKTGQLLGSTPSKLQIGEFFGVIAAALIMAPVLVLLIGAYGVGNENLPAPQAVMMANVVYGIFSGEMNWVAVLIGMVIALVLIMLDLPVMSVAIGLYLPFTLAVPILFGGLGHWWTRRFVSRHEERRWWQRRFGTKPSESQLEQLKWDGEPPEDAPWAARAKKSGEKALNMGVLLSSGLIAGEALMGVMIAGIVMQFGTEAFPVFGTPGQSPGVLVFIYIAFILVYFSVRNVIKNYDRTALRELFRRSFKR